MMGIFNGTRTVGDVDSTESYVDDVLGISRKHWALQWITDFLPVPVRVLSLVQSTFTRFHDLSSQKNVETDRLTYNHVVIHELNNRLRCAVYNYIKCSMPTITLFSVSFFVLST